MGEDVETVRESDGGRVGKWWSHPECDRLFPAFERCAACRAWAEGRIDEAYAFALDADAEESR